MINYSFNFFKFIKMKKYKEKENKNQKSTLVSLKEKKCNNNMNHKENENIINDNLNINNKKGFHHRKKTSSYFLGSYLQDPNIIENDNKKEDNIDINIEKKEKNNNNEKEEINQNELQNKLIYNFINTENSNNLSLSFPSYDEGNNNSVIIKKEDSVEKKQNKNENNLILELVKNSENSTKSFISFKNSLKYIKDKDERTTPSYQLALQADKKGGNNCYITTSNIIEEEKSSMIESKSEFSNKKEIILLDKEKKEKYENDKKILDEYFNDININSNWNIYGGKIDDKNKMSLALNEIILKNNKKEEDRRKLLTKNKMNLLNMFFTMSKALILNKFDKTKEITYKKEKHLNNANNNKYIKDKVSNNDVYFENKKFVKKFIKKSLNNNKYRMHSLTDNELQKNINNLNYENNIKIEDPKKITNKIPHLSNDRKINKKIKNDSPSNTLMNISCKALKTSNSNNSSSRNNSLISKKMNKILIKNDSRNRYNLHSLKRKENLNNALTFIREKKRNKMINSDLEKGKYYSNNTYNCTGAKKINNVTYTNSLTNSNLNTNNSNTQSHSKSKSKEKLQKIKLNNGSFNSKGDYISQILENKMSIEGNKEQTIMCLKHKLLFTKLYEKIDALEKINSTCFSSKSFFAILCENKINLKQFVFNGLYKFYKDKEKFVKIYGDEKSPNYILLKDIKEQRKYDIFEDNNVVNTFVNKFTLTNHFKFTSNSMILVKN